MATAPVKNVPASETVENIERRFRQLEAVWEADTACLSDAHKIIGHHAFQEIIALGEAVVPFMLRDLEKEPGQWVWALPRITARIRFGPRTPAIVARWRMPGCAGPGARLPMVDHLKAIFPKLAHASFRMTSDRDPGYNCIAWAAGVTHQRWWPLENPDEAYWPEGVVRRQLGSIPDRVCNAWLCCMRKRCVGARCRENRLVR